MKKITALITAIGLVCTMSTTSFATNDMSYLDGENYYDYLFYITGVTNSKLHDIENELGVDVYEYFGVDVPTEDEYQEYLSMSQVSSVSTQNARSTTTIDINYTMSPTQWAALLNVVEPSDILVTKDCTTTVINHGHAALACGGNKTVEHFGPKGVGIPGATGLSTHANIDEVWYHCKSCRLYEVPEADSRDIKQDIADEAIYRFVGWEYELTANKYSSEKVNCATLVWRAYDHFGITLGHLWTDTVIPSDFVERNRLNMIFSTGWGHVEPYVWASGT